MIFGQLSKPKNHTDLKNYSPNKNKLTAFVLGNEVFELKQKVMRHNEAKLIEIPQQGTKHSINVSVVSGIICWDFF